MDYWIYKNVHNGKYRCSDPLYYDSYDSYKIEDADIYTNGSYLLNSDYARVPYKDEIRLNRKLKLNKINESRG